MAKRRAMALEISDKPEPPRRSLELLRGEWRHHSKLVPLALAQTLLLADQPLLSTNMTQAAREFGFDDAEKDEMLGGLVALVYFTCGASCSLLAGRLADVMRRVTLVRACMFLGSLGTFLNSRPGGFAFLLLGRGLAGAAVGGLLPASFAMLADMYPAEERPHAIAMLAVASGIGPGLGQGLAGFAGHLGWRTPFAVLGLLGLLLSLLLFGLLQEPETVEKTPEVSNRSKYCGTWVYDLRKRTVLLVCAQGITGCVPWAVISTFLTDYLAYNAHMGVPGATAVGLSFGVGCFLGTVLGGQAGQRLYRRDKRYQAWFMALGTWSGMIPIFILFATAETGGHALEFHALALLGGTLVAGTGGNAKAVLLNTVPPKSRGSLFGVYTIMDDLGKGAGPALIASWVRALGRRPSFMIGIAFWLPCGLFCWLMTRTVLIDDLAGITVQDRPMADQNLEAATS